MSCCRQTFERVQINLNTTVIFNSITRPKNIIKEQTHTPGALSKEHYHLRSLPLSLPLFDVSFNLLRHEDVIEHSQDEIFGSKIDNRRIVV